MGTGGWTERKKAAWWVGFPVAVIATATAILGVGKWIYTRASLQDVAEAVAPKEDKSNAQTERGRIQHQLELQQQVLGNVRDNLIIIMDRQRLDPKPLPKPLIGDGP